MSASGTSSQCRVWSRYSINELAAPPKSGRRSWPRRFRNHPGPSILRRPQFADPGPIQRRRRAFSTYIAKCEHREVRSVLEDIVNISRDFKARSEPNGDVEAFNLGSLAQQQNRLQIPRRLQILIHTLLALRQL